MYLDYGCLRKSWDFNFGFRGFHVSKKWVILEWIFVDFEDLKLVVLGVTKIWISNGIFLEIWILFLEMDVVFLFKRLIRVTANFHRLNQTLDYLDNLPLRTKYDIWHLGIKWSLVFVLENLIEYFYILLFVLSTMLAWF